MIGNLECASRIHNQYHELLLNKIYELRLDSDMDYINESRASLDQYKMLSLELVNATKYYGNKYNMQYISSIIEKWKESIVKDCWRDKLRCFCCEHDDIIASFSAIDEGKRIFILVMDDSTTDKVLDYNEFCFKFREEHKDEIDDFMVLDKLTVVGIDELLHEVQNIYTKE